MFCALIEGHDDVCAQRNLDFDGPLRGEDMRRAVQMGTEGNTFFRDFAEVAQAEYLEAAGVSQKRPLPTHKFVQTAQTAHQFVPWPQIEMVGIAENDLRA